MTGGNAWRALFPHGRHIFYEGDDPAGFIDRIRHDYGLDPALIEVAQWKINHEATPETRDAWEIENLGKSVIIIPLPAAITRATGQETGLSWTALPPGDEIMCRYRVPDPAALVRNGPPAWGGEEPWTKFYYFTVAIDCPPAILDVIYGSDDWPMGS